MSSERARGPDDDLLDQLAVNLQIVSPSVGVSRPLLFPGLSAATTIGQLKEKIRESLPMRPADEHQRLIHRGRALLRETDCLLDVFGADALRNPDQQTIHLVLRDVGDSGSSSPAPTAPAQNTPRPVTHSIFTQQPPPGVTRRTPFQAMASPFPQPRGPSPTRPHSPAHTPEQAAAFQHQHQNMTSWLTQLQREAMARAAMANQGQRGRAAPFGLRGVGDTPPSAGGHGSEGNSGRASPVHPTNPAYSVQPVPHAIPMPANALPTHTIYREAIGPNGHSYHVETVIRTVGPAIPSTSAPGAPAAPSLPGGLSPVDVQSILRGADSSTANLQRSTSSTSLHNRSAPSVFAGGSRASSGRATPNQQAPGTRQGVEVYILSSPEGPRALVFNNSTWETYYSPRVYAPTAHTPLGPAGFYSMLHQPPPHIRGDAHQPPPTDPAQAAVLTQHDARPLSPHHQQQQQPQPQQQAPRPPALVLHPNNPAAAGLPALFMQMLPHFWLVVRLALFVWLFTSPTASWSRWLTVISLAVFLFALSTGLLNGIAEHAWRPLGRHLENEFPAAEFAREFGRLRQEIGARQNPNPDPAQMAARLVAEQREREPRLVGFARRVERAFLLFVASIAPGVAERHIANLEAEARAEEARRREAAANEVNEANEVNGANEAIDGGSGPQQEVQAENHEEAFQEDLIAL